MAHAQPQEVQHRTATADDLEALLIEAGASRGEAETIASAVAAQAASQGVVPSTSTEISLGAHSAGVSALGAGLTLRISLEPGGGRWVVKRVPAAVANSPVRVQGHVGDDLGRSVLASGVSEDVLDEFLKAMRLGVGASRLKPDDRFDLVLERRMGADGKAETGRLLYASLSRNGEPPLRVMRWREGERQGWLDEHRAPPASSVRLSRPVEGRVTSGFGNRRHPILGYKRLHKGIDIGAPLGTPIRAVADGRITFAGWKGGYGRQVRIGHGDGLASSYSHMSRIGAAEGSFVRKGEIIGEVGWTGLATGPHLHYEIHRDGEAINPASVTEIPTISASGTSVSEFERTLRRLRSLPVSSLTGT
jgi:murein DD-endopeptidase MepM/ murein hydrolase activator NlpD